MLVRFLDSLNRSAFRSNVLSLMRPGPLQEKLAALRIAPYSLGMDQGGVRLSNVFALRKVVRDLHPHILHGWMYHGNVAASFASLAGSSSIPVVWSIHHSVNDIMAEKPLTRHLIRLCAQLSRWTDAICYCSHTAADQHERLGFDARRRIVIPNGINCDEFKPDPGAKSRLRALLGLPSTRRIVGNVARSHPMKDQPRLVCAIGQLIDRGYDLHGLFIGPGAQDAAVLNTARELGIADRITALDARGDVQALMPGLDVYASSSAWGEAFPLAVTEAMASGVPAVVTDLGDCRWLVGDTGAVVPPKDTEALAEALRIMLDLTPCELQQRGETARARVAEHFSLRQYVARHQELYRQITSVA